MNSENNEDSRLEKAAEQVGRAAQQANKASDLLNEAAAEAGEAADKLREGQNTGTGGGSGTTGQTSPEESVDPPDVQRGDLPGESSITRPDY